MATLKTKTIEQPVLNTKKEEVKMKTESEKPKRVNITKAIQSLNNQINVLNEIGYITPEDKITLVKITEKLIKKHTENMYKPLTNDNEIPFKND